MAKGIRQEDPGSDQGREMSEYKLYLGDCLEFMRTMDARSVDAIVTDPPYGINLNTNYSHYPNGKNYRPVHGDKKPFDFLIWSNYPAKEQFWFGAENYINLPMPSNNWLCWDKYPTDRNDKRLSGQFELIWSKRKHKRIILRIKAINTSWITIKESLGHPNQKPLELIELIITKYIPVNSTVFDPYMGSGTTGVACMKTGRNFIGCEIDLNYFKIAENRIKNSIL